MSERLKHAFGEAFSAKGGSASGGQKGAKRVMALGSDTLGLTTDIIQQGFEALQSNDIVVGPAEVGLSHHRLIQLEDLDEIKTGEKV